MRKIESSAKMEKGQVYNLVYGGSNKAYAKINGKRTILVLKTKPVFEFVVLYDQFGSPQEDDLRSGIITVKEPVLAFKDDEICVPENESEWFKKSAKFTSLGTAMEQGVITQEDISSYSVRSGRNPFTSVSGRGGKFLGLYTRFDVEDKTSQPFLQAVFVWWKSREEMRADFANFGVNIQR